MLSHSASLLGVLVLGLMLSVPAKGQERAPRADSSRAWHDDAWTRIVEQDGVRIDYIYYPEADNEHDGIVLRLTNARDVAMGYAFTVVFRTPAAETTAVVRGRLSPGQMKTGDESGLFWVPFKGEDQSLAEIGLRGLRVWPMRKSGSSGTGPMRGAGVNAFWRTGAGVDDGKTVRPPFRKQR